MKRERYPEAFDFHKMHGLGNDFVVVDARGGKTPPTAPFARAIADRRRGVGFDQLVVIGDGDDAADASVSFLNADGSASDACGNGARCAAALVMRWTGSDRATLRSRATLLAADRLADGRIRVDMGPPTFDWRSIPLAEPADVDALPLDGSPSALSMGNPHCVFFVADAAAAPVETLGPEIERHPLFPERANVEFAEVAGRAALRLRVWERGVGMTEACGSGACAAAVAGMRRGLLDRRVAVRLDGGTLDIEWPETPGAGVLMTGPAVETFSGRLSADFFAEAAPEGTA